MQIPEWFARELRAQFNNRLRIRWSRQAQQFLVEQKIGRRRQPHEKISPFDDEAIRFTDGYDFVLGVTPGDRAQCPKCHQDSHVPVMRMKFAKCEHCGKDFRACHWPLGEGLLQWLRFTDPYRDGVDRIAADLDATDRARERAQVTHHRDQRADIIRDNFTRLFDIQSVGYTGREHAWVR